MFGLSIIIINYNTFKLTCDCIESIYKADLTQIDLEIVLVDNKSTEQESIDFIKNFKLIKYYKNQNNIGFAKANNVGITLCTKEYILLLNNDTVIFNRSTLIEALNCVNQADNKIILTTKLLTSDGRPQVCYGYFPSLQNELFFTLFIHKILSRKLKQKWLWEFVPDENRIITNGYITATFFLFHRRLIDFLPEKKLYDNLFLYGEELFWANQILNQDYKLFYLAEQSITHFIGSSIKLDAENSQRKKYQTLGEYLFLNHRYAKITVFLIYSLRIFRYTLLSIYSLEIRIRLKILIKILLSRKQV